jgi:hypothetical protein
VGGIKKTGRRAKRRAQALQLTAAQAGIADSTFGMLMDTGYREAVVSLLALSD